MNNVIIAITQRQKIAFNRMNRFSMLDFHDEIGMFPHQNGICACTVELHSLCGIPLWGFPLPDT